MLMATTVKGTVNGIDPAMSRKEQNSSPIHIFLFFHKAIISELDLLRRSAIDFGRYGRVDRANLMRSALGVWNQFLSTKAHNKPYTVVISALRRVMEFSRALALKDVKSLAPHRILALACEAIERRCRAVLHLEKGLMNSRNDNTMQNMCKTEPKALHKGCLALQPSPQPRAERDC
ncbi:hypothetical protein Tco_0397252 [Tanacetum coccineum]